jgi:hypothetical protein
MREALPLPCPYRYVLFDRDTKFGGDVIEFLQASSINPFAPAFGARGRTEWRSAGSAVFAVKCLIT